FSEQQHKSCLWNTLSQFQTTTAARDKPLQEEAKTCPRTKSRQSRVDRLVTWWWWYKRGEGGASSIKYTAGGYTLSLDGRLWFFQTNSAVEAYCFAQVWAAFSDKVSRPLQ
ncbi:hypothetical protein BaRGS_00007265, partial [Batillaria attramentaria]